jgi:hypothetical protein
MELDFAQRCGKNWSLILPRDAGKMELDFAQRCGKNRE